MACRMVSVGATEAQESVKENMLIHPKEQKPELQARGVGATNYQEAGAHTVIDQFFHQPKST